MIKESIIQRMPRIDDAFAVTTYGLVIILALLLFLMSFGRSLSIQSFSVLKILLARFAMLLTVVCLNIRYIVRQIEQTVLASRS